jgi:opacity protein-like surface antigen
MKKLLSLICLLPMLGALASAQEMRQDISLSFMGTIQPYINGGVNAVTAKSTIGTGLLLSYRYQLTPNGAFEANYSFSHYTEKFTSSFAAARVYTALQESTLAYVRTIPFKNFNPFIEFGGGIQYFTPGGGLRTTSYDTEQTEAAIFLFGGGVAYQLSPTWDLRMQYRGIVTSPQDFALKQFSIGRRFIVSQPAIGFAYHF